MKNEDRVRLIANHALSLHMKGQFESMPLAIAEATRNDAELAKQVARHLARRRVAKVRSLKKRAATKKAHPVSEDNRRRWASLDAARLGEREDD